MGRHKEVSSAIVSRNLGRRAKPNMHILPKNYIVGLTDGEGSFCVFIRKPKKKSWNARIECHYYIKMREDELPLLKTIKDSFDCGRISFQKEYRKNQRDNYRYQVSNLNDLTKIIIPFFTKNTLRSTPRKNDFLFFSRIVKMVLRKKHQTVKGLKKILQYKSRMHT